MSRSDQPLDSERSNEGFAARWSRRKREDSPKATEEPDEQSVEEAAAAPLTDADMPALETLNESSDYSGFMSPGVSEPLRKLALRRLFSTAEFNLRDGLDDYDDDFTDFAKLVDIITSDMRHMMEQQAESESSAQQTAEDIEPLVEDEEPDSGQSPETQSLEATEEVVTVQDDNAAEEKHHVSNE